MTVSCLSRTKTAKSGPKLNAKNPTQRPKPRKHHAAHVSLPSDAIVKQLTDAPRGPPEKLHPNQEAMRLLGPAQTLNSPTRRQSSNPAKNNRTSRPAHKQVGGSIHLVRLPDERRAAKGNSIVGDLRIGNSNWAVNSFF